MSLITLNLSISSIAIASGGFGPHRPRDLRRRLALPGRRVQQPGLGVVARVADELDVALRPLEQPDDGKAARASSGIPATANVTRMAAQVSATSL